MQLGSSRRVIKLAPSLASLSLVWRTRAVRASLRRRRGWAFDVRPRSRAGSASDEAVLIGGGHLR